MVTRTCAKTKQVLKKMNQSIDKIEDRIGTRKERKRDKIIVRKLNSKAQKIFDKDFVRCNLT